MSALPPDTAEELIPPMGLLHADFKNKEKINKQHETVLAYLKSYQSKYKNKTLTPHEIVQYTANRQIIRNFLEKVESGKMASYDASYNTTQERPDKYMLWEIPH